VLPVVVGVLLRPRWNDQGHLHGAPVGEEDDGRGERREPGRPARRGQRLLVGGMLQRELLRRQPFLPAERGSGGHLRSEWGDSGVQHVRERDVQGRRVQPRGNNHDGLGLAQPSERGELRGAQRLAAAIRSRLQFLLGGSWRLRLQSARAGKSPVGAAPVRDQQPVHQFHLRVDVVGLLLVRFWPPRHERCLDRGLRLWLRE